MRRLVCAFAVALLLAPPAKGAARVVHGESQPAEDALCYRIFDANRLRVLIRNDNLLGILDTVLTYHGTLLRPPIFYLDDVPLVYAAGLDVAARVNGQIRASAAHFLSDFVGGVFDEQGQPFGRGDSTFRVYRIWRDGGTAGNPDWQEWPAHYGAPVTPEGVPLLLGDQTLWSTFVDGYPEDRWVNSCPPLGAEVHLTAWGWRDFDNVLFLRYQVINRSDTAWNDAYLGMFVDADVDAPFNDLVGSDARLRLVYTYDRQSELLPEESGAAVGFVLIESPLVPEPGDTALTLFGPHPGYRSVPVYAPWVAKYWPPQWIEPSFRTAHTARDIWYRLQGLDTYGQPMIDRSTGYRTRWAFGGDPLTGRGWLDTLATDRRMMISAGPVDVAPGDTVTFGLAVLGVLNRDVLAAVDELKQQTTAFRSAVTSGVGLFTQPPTAFIGDSVVALPVRFARFARVERLAFDLSYDSTALEFAGTATRNVASVTSALGEKGKVHLVFDGILQGRDVASDTVAVLRFRIRPGAELGRYRYDLAEIHATAEGGEELEVPPVHGYIHIWRAASAPILLSPPDGELVETLGVPFRWTADTSAGLNRYLLVLQGWTRETRPVDGYRESLPLAWLYNWTGPDYEIRWWTERVGTYRRISSVDTFLIRLRPLEQLRFLGRVVRVPLHLESPWDQEIADVAWQSPFAFVLVKERRGTEGELLVLRKDGVDVEEVVRTNLTTTGQLAVCGQTVAVSGDEGFQVFRWQPDSGLLPVLSAGEGEKLATLVLNGPWLYGIDADESPPRLVVHALALPDSAPLIARIPLPKLGRAYAAKRLLLVRDTLLVAVKGDVSLFDVRDPGAPRLLARISENWGEAFAAAAVGKYLVVAYRGRAHDDLLAYDLSDPRSPQKVVEDEVGIVSGARLFSVGHRLFVRQSLRLAVTHVEPGQRWRVDRLDGSFWTVWEVTPELVLAQSGRDELIFAENRLPTSVSDRRARVPNDLRLLPAYPNPFNAGVKLRLHLPRPGRLRLVIFDVRGRVVRDFELGPLQAGVHTIPWDGRDDTGRAVPSGIYLACLRAGGVVRVQKLVCVR